MTLKLFIAWSILSLLAGALVAVVAAMFIFDWQSTVIAFGLIVLVMLVFWAMLTVVRGK